MDSFRTTDSSQRGYVALGYLILLIGLFLVGIGPVEMYCYYLFSEGGKFHYDGFRFGSFMFGNITLQVLGYFAIGILGVLLGWGHIKLLPWARRLTVSLLWTWLVVGLPIVAVALFILLATKNLSMGAAIASAILALAAYLLVPPLMIWFYGRKKAFEAYSFQGNQADWKNDLPTRLQVTVLFSVLSILVDFGMIFLNGVFPFFGSLYSGLPGIMLIEANCAILVLIALGTVKRSMIAWWLSVFYYSMMLISLVATATRNDYRDLLGSFSFPQTEVAMLQGIPLKSVHFVLGIGIPLLAILMNLFLSKRRYGHSNAANRNVGVDRQGVGT